MFSWARMRCEKGAPRCRFCTRGEVRALVLRPQAASRRVLASHFPLGPLAHIGASRARRPRVSVEEMRHPVALRSQPNARSLRVPHRWLACRHRFFALSIRCVGAGRMPRRQPRCSLLGSFASPAKSSSEATAVWALHQPSSPFEAGIGVARGICAGRELPRRSCASGRAKRSPSDRLPL